MIKNTLLSALVLLMATTQTAWAQSVFSGGDGSQATPYEISSADDWNALANSVNLGTSTYSGKYFKLTENIDGPVTTMIGTSESNAFSGTFDGDGHTITLNYTDERDEHYCGPFRFINGATIKNLHVAGTIVKTKKKHAGGIAGQAFGTNTIENCRSSVDIQAGTDGDGSHGGFIGDLRGGTTTMTGCTFDGKLRGPGGTASLTTKWGGFIGWVADGKKANFNRCVFAPAEVNLESTSGSRTFTGTYAPVSIGSKGDNTKLYLGDANTLYWPNDEMTIGCQRAYFQLNGGLTAGTPAGVRAFRLNFGDEANGIESIDDLTIYDLRFDADVWFTLDGRRLQGRPTKSGMYVTGGRKAVIK